MLVTKLLAIVGGALCALAAETHEKYPKSLKISYEVLGATSSKVHPLATVLYNPATLTHTLSSWTPPSLDSLKSTSKEPTSSPLVRILLPNGSTSVASLDSFDINLSQNINIWITESSDGEAFAVSISSITPPPLSEEEERQRKKEERLRKRGKEVPTQKAKPKSKKSNIKVEDEKEGGPVVKVNLIQSSKGPVPHLNTRKPPQVDADGREVVQEEQQEKSFFQKYWYVFLLLAIFMMGGGGGEK